MIDPLRSTALLSVLLTAVSAQDPASRVATVPESRPASAPNADDCASFAAGTITTGWLPLEAPSDRRLVVKGRVNGVETRIMIDSAASSPVLDTGFADSLGLEQLGDGVAKGVGGKREVTYRSGVRIEIGSLTLRPPRVLGFNFRGVPGVRAGIPVIVGRELFYQVVVDVDAPRSRLGLHAPSRFSYEGPGRTVPLVLGDNGEIQVGVQVEGLAPAMFVLDTGMTSALNVVRDYWSARGLLEKRVSSTTVVGGLGGSIIARIGTLEAVTIGGSRLESVPVEFIGDVPGAVFETLHGSGHVGMGILSRFRFILDYERERAHFEAVPGSESRPFYRDRLGFTGTFVDGVFSITFVAEGSPAEKAGLAVGQRVKAINSRALTEADCKSILSELAAVIPGAEVSLTDAKGDTRKLVAADYY
jgi:predicted aspartyl protease